MKNLLNKLQRGIYKISHTALNAIKANFAYTFIGGKFKAQQNEKNLCEKNKNSDIGDGNKKCFCMSEMRKYIDKFAEFFKKNREETLSKFLQANNISSSNKTILFFDKHNERAYLHFDNESYYIIYEINSKFQIKKRGLKNNFEYKIINEYGRYFLFINELKNPLPISEQLFYDKVEDLLTSEINSKKDV